MKKPYITVTEISQYYDCAPFDIGSYVLCRKDPDNPHDTDAIRCIVPGLGVVGHVAGSPLCVVRGTQSAGRIYDKTGKRFYARVCFVTKSAIICRIDPDMTKKKFKRRWKKSSKL
jgi:hypothetical protein